MKGFIAAIVAISGTFAVSWAASPVPADPVDPGLRSVPVRFDRQELATHTGIARLYQRLHSAASQACDQYQFQSVMPQRRRAFEQCVTLSLERAVAAVRDAGLSAYSEHRSTEGSPLAQARTPSPAPIDRAEARQSLVHDGP